MRMTTEEAFVKTLQRHGIKHAFGIIGSAMMPISDLFPRAGITFWDGAHEGSAGMMADGYTRATGEMSMMIAQNGPGITNFVTAVKTAYWNHTPLSGVSKPCWFVPCSDWSVWYAEASAARGDPPCPASIRPNSADCLPA